MTFELFHYIADQSFTTENICSELEDVNMNAEDWERTGAILCICKSAYVTVYEKTRHMGFFVKIKFDVYLISSTLELTYLQV